MTKRIQKIDIDTAASAAGCILITIPPSTINQFRAEAKRDKGRSPWTMLYLWLRSEHGAGAVDDRLNRTCTLHNRTRVGYITMETLRKIERIRLSKAFLVGRRRPPTSQELSSALSWSDLAVGPMTTDPNTGFHLVGDGLFVLPE